MNTTDRGDPSARIAALEGALKQARADADAEREQFERRLKLAKSALPEQRDPRTVAMNIAAQQEIDALRGALRERDRVVKELTEQVRGLEDRLEDHYRSSDDVKRQLKQREQELDDAERKLTLALRRVDTLRDAAQAPAAPAPAVPATPRPAAAANRPRAEARRGGGASRFVPGLLFGLLTGLLLAGSAAGALWWTGNLPDPPATMPGSGTSTTGAPFAR